jgi:hypothetical protein
MEVVMSKKKIIQRKIIGSTENISKSHKNIKCILCKKYYKNLIIYKKENQYYIDLCFKCAKKYNIQ